MKYREEVEKTQKIKEEYFFGFDKVIESKQNEAENKRREYTKDFFKNQGKFRTEFKQLLGWPLVDYEDNKLLSVTSEEIVKENGYTVYRMRFEILDGLKMYGLFFKKDSDTKKPMVIVQHGGQGTPELMSGMYGDTYNYNDIMDKVMKYDVHAFLPQLLLWEEIYGVKFDRKQIDARLKRVGSSITAVEIFGIQKIIDYFEKQEYISNFGMIGLSYGGFYTLLASAVETRIKSAISCSYFAKRDQYPWSDMIWSKMAEKFDDAEIACLSYPRRLCLEMADKDELFDYKYSLESYERIKEMCTDVGTDWVDLIIFEGEHEFCKDVKPIERLVKDIS